MKVKERRNAGQGIGGGYVEVRVVEIAEGGEVPADAVQVPDETPVSDWAREES